MSQNERPPRQGVTFNQILSSTILIAVLLVILVVGYVIVTTILALQAPVVSVPQAIGTQVQQVLNPTPTIIASPVTVIRQIRSLSRLETVSYKIEKVITAQNGEGPLGFLFEDKLLLVAVGEVIAGIDLGRMADPDVQVVDNTVTVRLPSSEIFIATLNNDDTFVYDRQTGLLGQQVDLETLARQTAEDEILRAAITDGILDTAQKNGEQVIRKLLEALGFEDITIITAPPTSDQNRGE
jgi:uncharacterized protein DUF4230